MDNNFQTSFIPKKPLAEERAPVVPSTSIFSFIATLLFFAALASAAGMYFYESGLNKSIAGAKTSLASARDTFEPSLITKLKTLDRRLTSANLLLKNHIAVTPIFAALSASTLKTVQFTKFSYITPVDRTAPILIRMSGKARDYSSIALESDQLATNKNIHNPIFSNLSLDATSGMVAFDLVFSVSPDLVRFTNNVSALISQQGTPQTTPATPKSTTPTTPTGTTPINTIVEDQPVSQ